jgi:molybdopterin synthase sulfur carrier subunit
MHVLYFAWVREKIGLESEEVTPPADVASVAALAAWLAQRSPGHAAALGDPTRLRAAIDQDLAHPDDSITTAREVAFFPPMTGG